MKVRAQRWVNTTVQRIFKKGSETTDITMADHKHISCSFVQMYRMLRRTVNIGYKNDQLLVVVMVVVVMR